MLPRYVSKIIFVGGRHRNAYHSCLQLSIRLFCRHTRHKWISITMLEIAFWIFESETERLVRFVEEEARTVQTTHKWAETITSLKCFVYETIFPFFFYFVTMQMKWPFHRAPTVTINAPIIRSAMDQKVLGVHFSKITNSCCKSTKTYAVYVRTFRSFNK